MPRRSAREQALQAVRPPIQLFARHRPSRLEQVLLASAVCRLSEIVLPCRTQHRTITRRMRGEHSVCVCSSAGGGQAHVNSGAVGGRSRAEASSGPRIDAASLVAAVLGCHRRESVMPAVDSTPVAAPSAFDGSKAGDEREVVGILLCWCPPGRFTMGSRPHEPERRPGEGQVEVSLTRGF